MKTLSNTLISLFFCVNLCFGQSIDVSGSNKSEDILRKIEVLLNSVSNNDLPILSPKVVKEEDSNILCETVDKKDQLTCVDKKVNKLLFEQTETMSLLQNLDYNSRRAFYSSINKMSKMEKDMKDIKTAFAGFDKNTLTELLALLKEKLPDKPKDNSKLFSDVIEKLNGLSTKMDNIIKNYEQNDEGTLHTLISQVDSMNKIVSKMLEDKPIQ